MWSYNWTTLHIYDQTVRRWQTYLDVWWEGRHGAARPSWNGLTQTSPCTVPEYYYCTVQASMKNIELKEEEDAKLSWASKQLQSLVAWIREWKASSWRPSPNRSRLVVCLSVLRSTTRWQLLRIIIMIMTIDKHHIWRRETSRKSTTLGFFAKNCYCSISKQAIGRTQGRSPGPNWIVLKSNSPDETRPQQTQIKQTPAGGKALLTSGAGARACGDELKQLLLRSAAVGFSALQQFAGRVGAWGEGGTERSGRTEEERLSDSVTDWS